MLNTSDSFLAPSNPKTLECVKTDQNTMPVPMGREVGEKEEDSIKNSF